ncbi:unnamed protein product, partial [Rotaria sp. Silwood2]
MQNDQYCLGIGIAESSIESVFILGANEVLPYFFQSNRIHTDSGMTTIGTYLLTLFKHQITSWL